MSRAAQPHDHRLEGPGGLSRVVRRGARSRRAGAVRTVLAGVDGQRGQLGLRPARRPTDEITPQHYAFLISEDEFDAIFGRIVERGIDYYADPAGRAHGEINHNDGGRGVYFPNPDGHWLEILTRPYGSGG